MCMYDDECLLQEGGYVMLNDVYIRTHTVMIRLGVQIVMMIMTIAQKRDNNGIAR